jgi:hypothetical protein
MYHPEQLPGALSSSQPCGYWRPNVQKANQAPIQSCNLQRLSRRVYSKAVPDTFINQQHHTAAGLLVKILPYFLVSRGQAPQSTAALSRSLSDMDFLDEDGTESESK